MQRLKAKYGNLYWRSRLDAVGSALIFGASPLLPTHLFDDVGGVGHSRRRPRHSRRRRRCRRQVLLRRPPPLMPLHDSIRPENGEDDGEQYQAVEKAKHHSGEEDLYELRRKIK